MKRTICVRWLDPAIALAIFALALAVYNATLTPSLSYKSADGNELATVCYTLGLAHSTGYPLYTWLGKLFTFIPVGDVAHRVNLMSAVLGAAGVALLYLIMLAITNRRLPSAFTALFFAFSLTFWSQAVIAEVYTPNVFMIALTVWMLLQWETGGNSLSRSNIALRGLPNPRFWPGSGACPEPGRRDPGQAKLDPPSLRRAVCLLLAALAFGLSLGTHLSNLGFALAFALYVLLVDWRVLKRPAVIAGALALFLLGCLQFFWLPYKASTLNDAFMLRNAPRTLESIYRYTLGAFPEFKFAFPLQAIPDRIVLYLELLRWNFGVVGIALGVYGMWEMLFRHTRKFYLFITMYLVHVFFFVQYRVFDLDVFFIPAHFIYVIFIGYGVYRLVEYVRVLLNLRNQVFGAPCIQDARNCGNFREPERHCGVEKPGFSLAEQADRCFRGLLEHDKVSFQKKTWFLVPSLEVFMSKSQKLLISFGAFIIVAVMVIGAFSMGIYVGERGWTAAPPSIAGAGRAQPPQGQRVEPGKQPPAPAEPLPKGTVLSLPKGAVLSLPKGKPDLIGVVQSVARKSVTIKTGQGPRLVLVNDETRVRWHDDRAASLADLRRNMAVAVFGQFGDDGRTLTASVIVILPPKT